MFKKLLSVVIVVACVGLGFFVNEYMHLKKENEDLRLLVIESMSISRKVENVSASCLQQLTDCTRVVDIENPQIRDGMMRRHEISGFTTAAQKRDGCVTPQQGP